MNESSPQANAMTAFSLLSHLYLTPVLVALIRGGVPDHLDQGPLPAKDLAKRAGLDELSLTRALRALGAFGAFQEVSPGIFANNSAEELEPSRALRPNGFSYPSTAFAALASTQGLGSGLSLHRFARNRDRHFTGFAEFAQFCIAGPRSI
jgi:hypothetical protein